MNKSDINEQAADRETLINKLDKVLNSLVKRYQASLLSDVLEVLDEIERDEDGVILNNAANTAAIAKLDRVLSVIDFQAKAAIINQLIKGFANVISFNRSYFEFLDPDLKVKPVSDAVMKDLKTWLGIGKGNKLKRNGYLDTLVGSTSLRNEIKQRTVGAVANRQGWAQTKKDIGGFIKGEGKALGAMERYYRNFTYDTFAQVDRRASEDFAERLGFEFAIYAGGLIETSRKFCREHNGNVYHISEIREFKPKEAIPPNYDPLTDLGGYGCRHSLNWIPNVLAVRLRGDASIFIKK